MELMYGLEALSILETVAMCLWMIDEVSLYLHSIKGKVILELFVNSPTSLKVVSHTWIGVLGTSFRPRCLTMSSALTVSRTPRNMERFVNESYFVMHFVMLSGGLGSVCVLLLPNHHWHWNGRPWICLPVSLHQQKTNICNLVSGTIAIMERLRSFSMGKHIFYFDITGKNVKFIVYHHFLLGANWHCWPTSSGWWWSSSGGWHSW